MSKFLLHSLGSSSLLILYRTYPLIMLEAMSDPQFAELAERLDYFTNMATGDFEAIPVTSGVVFPASIPVVNYHMDEMELSHRISGINRRILEIDQLLDLHERFAKAFE